MKKYKQSLTDIGEVILQNLSKDELTFGHFKKNWVYKEKTSVFDYVVGVYFLAFDLVIEGEMIRLEFFERNRNPVFAQLMEFVRDSMCQRSGKYLLLSCPISDFNSAIASEIIVATVKVVQGKLSRDAREASARFLFENLLWPKKISVADIGANPLYPNPYDLLKEVGGMSIVGFEPHPEAFEKLMETAIEGDVYFNEAVGDGSEIELHIYESSGFTSAFPISSATINYLNRWRRATSLISKIKIPTKRLDEITDLPVIDLLKIDIQGGELNVFLHGKKALERCLCVIPEVNFLELYDNNAPSFADIHQELTSQGFILHKFLFIKSMNILGQVVRHPALQEGNSQVIDGDAVYIKDIRYPEKFSDDDLRKLAIMADAVFESRDLAVRCLEILMQRGRMERGLAQRYLDLAFN